MTIGARIGGAGDVLIETLIAVLIVSIAMLGIMAMYAASVRNSSEARYRAEASFIADEIIARMRMDARRPTVLKADYEGGIGGTDGVKYTAWVSEVINDNRLPGFSESPPRITIVSLDGFSPPDTAKSLVTIEIRWQLPNSTVVHEYVTSTGIQ